MQKQHGVGFFGYSTANEVSIDGNSKCSTQ